MPQFEFMEIEGERHLLIADNRHIVLAWNRRRSALK
jgi:hypothetical protein